MRNLFYFFILTLLALSFTACKKDKNDLASNYDNIPGVYRITALKAKVDNQQVDVFNQLNECQKSDTWDFEQGGTFLFGGVATASCQDGDYSGTWSLNGKVFTIVSQASNKEYQLESFDGRALVLSTDGTLNNSPATYYITFTK